jgi:hypothetical protein
MSDRDCIFRGIRVNGNLLQQVTIEVAGRDAAMPCFPIALVHDRDFSTQLIQVHQALQQPGSQLEQQTLILDLLAKLVLRYAKTPPGLVNLGVEIQPADRVGAQFGTARYRLKCRSVEECRSGMGSVRHRPLSAEMPIGWGKCRSGGGPSRHSRLPSGRC